MKVIKPAQLSSTDGSITRATTATYVDSTGILKVAAIDEVRFNHNFNTLVYEGLLIEESRTNLLTYSEVLHDTTKWDVGSTLSGYYTVTNEGVLLSPYGTTGGVAKFISTGTQELFLRKSGLSLTSGTTYSSAIFVYVPSQAGVTSFRLQVDFNDADATGYTEDITAFNKWVKVVIPLKSITAARTVMDFNIAVNSGTAVPSGFTFYAMGAQLEAGASSSSYIPTVASAVTRAADVSTGYGLMYTTVTDSTAVWSSGATYALGAKVRYSNRIWESVQASNTNHTPTSSPTWWLEIGPDNMHAAFDNQISTVSTAITSMTFVVRVGNVIDSVALINMSAVTADIVMFDPVAGIVVNEKSGLSGLAVYDWYQYFFYDPLLIRTQVIFSGLPAYSNAYITIRLTGNLGDIVSLALAAFGQIETLGGTQYGANSGIIDYSVKETDEFGTVTFVKRNFSKRLSAQLFIDNNSLNRVSRYLSGIRATPVVWIGADDPRFEEAVIVYGFYKEFSMDIAYPNHSLCSLEIEGLT